jgi:hypothetical protein
MSEKESREMVLWRPLFEGLAKGVRSEAKTSAGGVGCLVQRASILALRSILMRHGHLFSAAQLAAILEQTVLPAIQIAAESDTSPVVGITSESPAISNIDFLADSPQLPPEPDDPALLQFEALNTMTPNRSFGPAELMLEASFTDLRHGGDGDLRKAYILAKKAATDEDAVGITEQPFPDSWLATTAPLALGLLTDIVTEFIVYRESEGREILWPIVAKQYKLWYSGRQPSKDAVTAGAADGAGPWSPCEALVRIVCRELHRLPCRFSEEFSELAKEEIRPWVRLIFDLYSELLAESVETQAASQQDLTELKDTLSLDQKDKEADELDRDDEVDEVIVYTPYGRGRLIEKRKDVYPDPSTGTNLEFLMNVVALDFGATLYRPVPGTMTRRPSERQLVQGTEANVVDSGIPTEVSVPEAYWVKLVPALKIRCVAAHCLQQSLIDVLDQFVALADKDVVFTLRNTLERSRRTAEGAAKDEDISTAFQESLLKDWGDGIAIAESMETDARLSLQRGSAMFFLTQEAGAAKALIHMLSLLYLRRGMDGENGVGWNRVGFAEPYLLEVMTDSLSKFLASEEEEGHLVGVKVWRNVTESGVKVALYCTSFASVVVEILKNVRSFQPEQFEKHKQLLFPLVCALIRVQSEEIRQCVQEVLALQVAPVLGVKMPLPRRSSIISKSDDGR